MGFTVVPSGAIGGISEAAERPRLLVPLQSVLGLKALCGLAISMEKNMVPSGVGDD